MKSRPTRRSLLRASSVAVVVALAGCDGYGETAVRNASVGGTTLYAGSEVTVEAVVKNTGITRDKRRINVSVDGTVVDSETVELDRGERTTVTFTRRLDEPGTYSFAVDGVDAGTVTVKPAVEISNANLRKATTTLGDVTWADATVRNHGEASAKSHLELRVGDDTVERRTVTVPVGGSQSIEFRVLASHVGEHEVTVNETALGTLTVENAWRQFGYDGGHTGYNRRTNAPSEPTTHWSAGLFRGEGSRSSPVVSGDTAYVGVGNPYGADDFGGLAAFDCRDGEPRWRTETEGPVYGAPALAGGRVIVGTTNGSPRNVENFSDLGGHVSAYSMADGSVAWTHSVGNPVATSPAVADGTVYVTVSGGTILALDAVDGTRRWKRSLDGKRCTAPAVADGTLYVGDSDGILHALTTADGSERWSADTGDSLGYAPTVADETVYVASPNFDPGSYGSKLHAISVTDGDRRWERTFDETIAGSVAVDDDGIYANVGISVWGFDREDGRVRWRGPDARAGTGGGNPTVVDGTVYAGVGRVNGGFVYAFDAESGTVEWQYETDAGGASPTVHDGAVYATVGFGSLLALR